MTKKEIEPTDRPDSTDEDIVPYSDCDEVYTAGHCPCCGSSTRTQGGNYDDDPMRDICDECGWTEDWQYG